jgi:multiple antibiotic resistance protein
VDTWLKSFISLFVAIDALGALPLVIGVTRGLSRPQRRRVVYKATLAALLVGLLFLFAGQSIFRFLGILEADFRIAGGLLLIIFAIRDLMVASSHQGVTAPVRVGIVPIAMPLIMGPAALATLILSAGQFGYGVTVVSLLVNLLITWAVFSRADWVTERLGEDISDVVAKVSSLLLAAIGVMLVRSGILSFIG